MTNQEITQCRTCRKYSVGTICQYCYENNAVQVQLATRSRQD